MTGTRIYSQMMLLAASATPRPTDSAVPDVQEVVNQMNSNASAEDKTSFLLEYLMAQREPLLNFGKTLLIALIVFLIGKRIIALLLKLLNRWMERSHVEVSVHKFIMSLGRVLLYILLIFCVAGILGVGTSSIIAIIGSAGLAVGLALQGSLSNLAGGILILLMKPFLVGDYIVAGGVEGTVRNIDIFYTRIVTTDNKVIVIPNGTLSNGNIINTSQEEYRLLILDFMVGYDAQISKVREVVLNLMEKDEGVCKDRPQSVNIDKLNPGRVRLQPRHG
ncbi:mechanosensitive ion channel family protein [Roseburia sp. AM59-24XD]|uniref:mechanosensitive ion channel family protein n=1 Tax=Roseburia sp. AM59-24XD TaxID=2293138 RepID=UPI000E4D9532|nr:mechanosensitive ion channel domain-containing protein [Roseburia sp. AM59-24XD]RHP89000.1 mechanosensitive ion channel family protein [Roseburia sp. AM59-24XD]